MSKLLPFKAGSFQFGDSPSESPKSAPTEIESNPNLHKETEESIAVETMDDDDTRADNNTPVLDNLIDKFERNHASMEYQTKQMKRFMK